METITPDEVLRSPRLTAAVDRVTRTLEELAQKDIPSESITAEWGVYHDRKERAGLDLAIAHPTGTASLRFPPEKLSDEDFLEWASYRIWRDILRVRSHANLARLNQLIAALSDEE